MLIAERVLKFIYIPVHIIRNKVNIKMKGVSAVIATILMLMITIAIAGMAYMYISGIFTTRTQGIEIADYYCTAGTVTLRIRNIGTVAISTGGISWVQTAPSVDTTTSGTAPSSGTIEPGQISDLTDVCDGSGGRSCVYRLTPPTGNSIVANVYCT